MVQAHTLQEEVDKIQGKGTLGNVANQGPGYYSQLTLMQKATEWWKPVGTQPLCHPHSLQDGDGFISVGVTQKGNMMFLTDLKCA